ncbi:bifunctional riboflavin kinase/FAD synthetase [bacterium]|nr:bifunctional riboflavin kinase/FAD synthetase [bacterium]
METIWNLYDYIADAAAVVTVGTFDGVHLGHQQLILRMTEKARSMGRRSLVVTFEPPPQIVVQRKQESSFQLLTTIEEKIVQLRRLGIDTLLIMPFSPSFADMGAEQFVEEVLIDRLRMAEIFIGSSHTFGRGRSGNLALLKTMAQSCHFSVSMVEPVYHGDEMISSTRIRSLLKERRIEEAAQFLGRPYSLQGRVIRGDGRGRQLGFPTVNLKPYSIHKLVPQSGIYLSRFHWEEVHLPAVTYIGMRPTFGLSELVIETHVLDFEEEMAGREITIELLRILRDDIQFETTQQLIEQIHRDVAKSQELFKTSSR